jgi:hypothetical protein
LAALRRGAARSGNDNVVPELSSEQQLRDYVAVPGGAARNDGMPAAVRAGPEWLGK